MAGERGVALAGSNFGTLNTGTIVDTGGVAYVGGNVTAGRDFVGQDRITTVTQVG